MDFHSRLGALYARVPKFPHMAWREMRTGTPILSGASCSRAQSIGGPRARYSVLAGRADLARARGWHATLHKAASGARIVRGLRPAPSHGAWGGSGSSATPSSLFRTLAASNEEGSKHKSDSGFYIHVFVIVNMHIRTLKHTCVIYIYIQVHIYRH